MCAINGVHVIYRVADKDGIGPYQSELAWSLLGSHNGCDQDGNRHHPGPHQDEGIKRRPHDSEFCGFATMDDLHNWFSDDELAELAKHGYSIVKESGFVTAIGQKQILFRKIDIGQVA